MASGFPLQLSDLSRKQILKIIWPALVAISAYECASVVIGGDFDTMAYAVLLASGLLVIVAILNDWRRGLYIFLGWILFEDLVRKFLGNNMLIYFAKDVIVLVLYVSFFWSTRFTLKKLFQPPFRVAFSVFFWFAALQLFNPSSSSIFYGLLGIKLYFWYVPLIFVGYSFIEQESRLEQIFTYLLVLTVIVVGLAIAQSIIGPTFLNPTVMQDDIALLSHAYRESPVTGLRAYRPTSVFVSTGRLQNFLLVSWPLTLGFGGYLLLRGGNTTGAKRLFAFTTIAIVACGSIMSVSRGVLMWNLGTSLVVLLGFAWGAPWRTREGHRLMRVVQRLALFIGVGFMILSTVFPEEVGSRLAIFSETLSPASANSELIERSRDYPWRNFIAAFDDSNWPYGHGIGTSSLGIQYVTRIMKATPLQIGVENGYGQLIIELGIVGLLLWIVLAVAICVSCWKIVKSFKGSPRFPLVFSIFWYAFLLLIPMSYYSFIAYQDFVMNAFLWVLLGILFHLNDLHKEELKTAQTLSTG